MEWNYRVVKELNNGKVLYAIRQVHYNSNGDPILCSDGEVSPTGESLDELTSDFILYGDAFKYPALDFPQDFDNVKHRQKS